MEARSGEKGADDNHRHDRGEDDQRASEEGSRGLGRPLAEEIVRGFDLDQADADGDGGEKPSDEIGRVHEIDDDRNEEGSRDDRMPSGCEPGRFGVGDHLIAGLTVLFAIEPSDGHEVRELPEDEYGGENPAVWIDEGSVGGGPSHEYWESAGDGTDGGIPPGVALHRSVDPDVEAPGEEAKGSGEPVGEEEEVSGTDEEEEPSEEVGFKVGQASVGERAFGGAWHKRIAIDFEPLIEDAGARGDQTRADHGMEEDEQRGRPRDCQDRNGDGQEDHDDDARLGQLNVVRPDLFEGDGRKWWVVRGDGCGQSGSAEVRGARVVFDLVRGFNRHASTCGGLTALPARWRGRG